MARTTVRCASAVCVAILLGCGGSSESGPPPPTDSGDETFETARRHSTVDDVSSFHAEGAIDPSGDVDFLVFATSSAGEVSVRLVATPSPDVLEIRFEDSARVPIHVPLVQRGDVTGNPNVVRHVWLAPGAGDYYASVRGKAGAVGGYGLDVSFRSRDGNDTADAATPVVPGTPTDGEITTRELMPYRDVDYYRLAVAAPGSIVADVTTLIRGLVLRVLGPDKTVLASDMPLEPPLHVVAYAATAGTYYLSVSGSGDALGKYRLTSSFTESVDGNDSFATAAAIELGHPVTGAVSTPTDVDYFTFTLPDVFGLLRVTLSGLAADLDLALYDYDLSPLAESVTPGTATEQIVVAPTREWVGQELRYYAKVHGYAGAKSNFLLSVGFGPDGDETRETATPIALGVGVAGSIGFYDDVDWYSVVTTGPGECEAVVTKETGLYLTFYAFDVSGLELGWGYATGSTWWSTVGGETFFVKLDGEEGATYILRVTCL
jgi:hypothetical protein